LVRKRSEHSLRLQEREDISREFASGMSIRAISVLLAQAPSTISREVKRNGGREAYRSEASEKRAWDRAHRPKLCKLAKSARLRRVVAARLGQEWSPEQIAGWLGKQYPGNSTMLVSLETIYRSSYVQARGALKREPLAYLRTRRRMRKARSQAPRSQKSGSSQDEVSIRDRPVEVEDRSVPGHWEGGLIEGSRNTYVAALVERTSRFTLLVRVDNKNASTVCKALARHLRKLPIEVRQSLNWDRGSGLAQHKKLAMDTDIDVLLL
jgi:IS30 family transposase